MKDYAPPFRQGHYLERACDGGFPRLDFEFWYQRGVSCYQAGLPKSYRRRALDKAIADWEGEVQYWMLRAFTYGAAGRDSVGIRSKILSPAFQWPQRPDPSWEVVVCHYPDGACELDMVHSVSRRFWSEIHGFFEMPEPQDFFNRSWFEMMGFNIITMNPGMLVDIGTTKSHLFIVRGRKETG